LRHGDGGEWSGPDRWVGGTDVMVVGVVGEVGKRSEEERRRGERREDKTE
jgi:hypothetical protein